MLYAPSDIFVHQGDTLHWVVQSHDIHTVTFLAPGQTLPPFDFSPGQIFPNHPSGSTYDGLSYFNSGLMSLSASPPGFPPIPTNYDLVMGKTGTFNYYCIVHGTMMHGVVHVLPTSAKLPRNPHDVRGQISQAKAEVSSEGRELKEQAKDIAADQHIVLVGIGEMARVGMVEVVRFFPSTIKMHVGQTLTFVSMSMMPHTFSIFPPDANFDPFAPVGDGSNYTGGPFNRFVPPGGSFTLKVTAPLSTPFFCTFTDTLGMVGQLIAA